MDGDWGNSLEARVLGTLAGVAVGDALGMPAEFLTREQIVDWYGQIDHLTDPHARHPHHRLPAGAVTDDTDHTLILARLLIDQGCVDPVEFARRLLAWAGTARVKENRFVGPSTLRSIAALEAGTPLDQVPRGGVTVGAAMRVAPLAIVFADRALLAEQVVASCSVGHFTRNAISGAMSMAFALSQALEPDADLHSIAHAAQEGAVLGRSYGDWSWSPPIERRIDYLLNWVDQCSQAEFLERLYVLIGVDLYPEQLVPAAIGLVLLSDGDPQAAMMLAANLGGDTDTLASMTGSICGAFMGIKSLNERMVAQVERVNQFDLSRLAGDLLSLRAG